MDISNMPKMICVCLTMGTDCNEDPFVAEVKGITHLFCCQKGFEESLKQFADYIGKERKHYKNN